MSLTQRFLWLAALVAIAASVGIWVGGALAQAWLIPALLLVALLLAEQVLTRAYRITLERRAPSSVELGRDLNMSYRLTATPARALQLDFGGSDAAGLERGRLAAGLSA